MAGRKKQTKEQGREFMALLRAIAAHEISQVLKRIQDSPEFALQVAEIGASRQDATDYFLQPMGHYVYAGDTALHIAGAAHSQDIVQALLTRGACVVARNRRGAEPLHYAADGNPDSPNWNPQAQANVVACLIQAGADPNSADKSGVSPLHRAVRTRCAAAVEALLAHGADPRRPNGGGSTPLHLAVQNTGRGGSGTAAARDQQRQIIRMLLKRGARPADQDSAGKSVAERVASDWMRELLEEA